MRDPDPHLEDRIGPRGGLLQRLITQGSGPGQLPHLDRRFGRLRHELQPAPVPRRQELPGALEQVGGGRGVPSRERPVARRRQGGGRPFGQPSARLVHRAQLGPEPGGLLQVVAEDLLVLVQPRPGAFEPPGERLVERRPPLLRHPLVGRVPDQLVPEPEGLLAGELRSIGPDQLLAA